MVPGQATELRVVDVDAGAPAPSSVATDRILDATLGLVARWGVHKTALADVAKAAGCSRATIYRAFPGGKQHLLVALGERELTAYVAAITEAVDGADDLADALTRGLVVASRLLRDHDAAQFIVNHEPDLLLPLVGFREGDRVLRLAAVRVGPHLERFVAPDRAAWAAEWAARVFTSYLFNPRADLDLAVVDDARSVVERFMIPAFAVTSTTTPHP